MEPDIRYIEKLFPTQQLEWKVLRVFWTLMGMALIAGACGFLGTGFLSTQTYSGPGLQIKYEKFMRVEKDVVLFIQAKDLGEKPAISINNNYLQKVRISQVVPEPAAVEIRNNRLIYRFNSLQNGTITFYLDPIKMGSQPLEITLAGQKMRFQQYIYF